VNGDRHFARDITFLVRAICQTADQNTIIVAAAGNDSVAGQRMPPRYPAKFDDVVGVGALDSTMNQVAQPPAASYSNQSDAPLMRGVMTFGGDGSAAALATPKQIKGVYTADTFPNGDPNDDHYANWSGTSFATPIISGRLAQLCVENANTALNPYLPLDAFNALLASSTRRTPQGEEVIEVTIR
jgi:subtilisin family serine protease